MSIHFSTKGVRRSSGLLHVVEGLPLAELAVLLLYLLLAGLQVAVVNPAIKRIRKDADGISRTRRHEESFLTQICENPVFQSIHKRS